MKATKAPQSPEEAIHYLESAHGISNITCRNWGEKASGFSLFYGYLGADKIFIKWGGKRGNSLNDFTYTKRMHEMAPEYFLKPFFCINEEKVQCLALEYAEGRTLKNALTDETLTEVEKGRLVRALPAIAKALIAANCVHRDIKPDNFLLLKDGSIKLFDFEFATEAQPYKERTEVLRFPYYVSAVGTKSECGVALGIGKFMWDDIVIFRRILERIGCSSHYAEAYAEAIHFFRSEEGKRILRYPGRRSLIVQRKLVDLLAAVLPVRSWRHKVRMLNRKARF